MARRGPSPLRQRVDALVASHFGGRVLYVARVRYVPLRSAREDLEWQIAHGR